MDADGCGVSRITDYQFVKALQQYGHMLLIRSMKPAILAKRKDAAKTMINHFNETYDITYSESQIFKKINNLKQRLKEKVNSEKLREADALLIKLLAENNVSVTRSIDDDDNGTHQITPLQFVKTLSECGRALLISSKKLAAQSVKKNAAKSMRDTFAEDFGIVCTERQILKRFYSMTGNLKCKINKKGNILSSTTEAEMMLLKLLRRENHKSECEFVTFNLRFDL